LPGFAILASKLNSMLHPYMGLAMRFLVVRKPGAFARYRYREELFPSLTFRQAYDALCLTHGERADVEYVRLLQLAATTSERSLSCCAVLDAMAWPRIRRLFRWLVVARFDLALVLAREGWPEVC
jgi:hypothetical protein